MCTHVCVFRAKATVRVKYYPFQANLSLSECQSQSGPDLRRGFTAVQLHDNMKIKKGSDQKSIIGISDDESYIIQDFLSKVLLRLNTLFGVFCNCTSVTLHCNPCIDWGCRELKDSSASAV